MNNMNKEIYTQMIEQDISRIIKEMPNSPERSHTIDILKDSINTYFPQSDKSEEILAVKKLGDKIGYGQLMHIASALWRYKLKPMGVEIGAFVPTLVNFIKDEKEIQSITQSDIESYDNLIENYIKKIKS
jgi:molybdopterin synthase catalytic subunit